MRIEMFGISEVSVPLDTSALAVAERAAHDAAEHAFVVTATALGETAGDPVLEILARKNTAAREAAGYAYNVNPRTHRRTAAEWSEALVAAQDVEDALATADDPAIVDLATAWQDAKSRIRDAVGAREPTEVDGYTLGFNRGADALGIAVVGVRGVPASVAALPPTPPGAVPDDPRPRFVEGYLAGWASAREVVRAALPRTETHTDVADDDDGYTAGVVAAKAAVDDAVARLTAHDAVTLRGIAEPATTDPRPRYAAGFHDGWLARIATRVEVPREATGGRVIAADPAAGSLQAEWEACQAARARGETRAGCLPAVPDTNADAAAAGRRLLWGVAAAAAAFGVGAVVYSRRKKPRREKSETG